MKAGFFVLVAIFATACTIPSHPHGKSEIICQLCQEIVQTAEQYLNDDEADIANEIDNLVCNHYRPLETICDALVKQLLPLLIQEIYKGLTPIQCCQEVDCC
uniref:Saposin B-type domain-containing protein n=1 Tax=Plectus sambesii TaxID=2011161 RepID=A0A914VT85_9BILA